MAAIEDAILLGCDAVNLSLGSTSPGYATNAVYQDLLDRLSETDVVVSVAAGNAGSWADGVWNGHLYSDAVSLDMVGSPGSYTNALTVASADNVGYTGRYLTVQEQAIFYTKKRSPAISPWKLWPGSPWNMFWSKGLATTGPESPDRQGGRLCPRYHQFLGKSQ